MISREEVLSYIAREYGVEPDYPWARTPHYAILRHAHNKKWFAAVMDITEDKLGLKGNKPLDAVNVKCDPLIIASCKNEPGIFPAYHMNKEHWITIRLDSALEKAKVYDLIDISYDLTR